MLQNLTKKTVACYHCGEDCGPRPIVADHNNFCCEGCKMVYDILNQNGLCDYYNFTRNPGNPKKIKVRQNKFAFLDDDAISKSLISFGNDTQTYITFYIPQIHCSSCLWLLENLHQLNENIISSKVTFSRKEVDIVFNHEKITLRQVAETLTSIGYEPYISLNDAGKKKKFFDRSKIYKLGVAGFCFFNIMLLSFPEYLGIDAKEAELLPLFRTLAVLLSLPVFFYSATEFYNSAWKSLKHGFLNIDAPIVLAIIVTFGRSIYEVISGTGGGYFDSLSGIVFFMLIGRVLQDKTFQQLSFDRDYTSYFPIAVTRIKNKTPENIALKDIKLDDTLLIHNEELVPADGILTRGSALIDYSFVTGESLPVVKEVGEIVYAGGKQTGSNIELLVIKEVAQSYLTKLWNRDEPVHGNKEAQKSFVHLVSRHFTLVVFSIALLAAMYWWLHEPGRIWNSVTAILIIACPCALLLSNTFTNGNVLRILSRNGLYLKSAQTIENIAAADHIVFDKTGTLTTGVYQDIFFKGKHLHKGQYAKIATLAAQSNHPLSKAVAAHYQPDYSTTVSVFNERAGAGIEGIVDGQLIALGSANFILGKPVTSSQTELYVSVDGAPAGRFVFKNAYRSKIGALIKNLARKYSLSVLSGDNAGEQDRLRAMMGNDATIQFRQKPADKLDAIRQLQQQGKTVIMIGDGLNDAGALHVADAGIAVSEHCNNFTPASDAIIEAGRLPLLDRFIRLCQLNRRVVIVSFIISIVYNIAGLYFAVQGLLAPVIAAILMPASSISIVLITFGATSLAAKRMRL